jgi:hypothetical protein
MDEKGIFSGINPNSIRKMVFLKGKCQFRKNLSQGIQIMFLEICEVWQYWCQF